jgi:hypothetical protein
MIRDLGCCLGVLFLLGCGFGCLKFGMGGCENCLKPEFGLTLLFSFFVLCSEMIYCLRCEILLYNKICLFFMSVYYIRYVY